MNRRDFLKTNIAGSVMLIVGGTVLASTYYELPKCSPEAEVVAWYGHHKMQLRSKRYDVVKQASHYIWELLVTPGLPNHLDCTIKCGDELVVGLSPQLRATPSDPIVLSFVWSGHELSQG